MTQPDARMHWMDFLRGVAVLLVVVLHAAQHGGATVLWWDEANRYLAPFRMPLLMFLSGLLLTRSLAKPLPLYLWGKIAAVGWPLLVWLSLYGLLIRGGLGLPEDIVDYLATGDYLWFLMALLICYAVGAGFRPLVVSDPRTGGWAFLALSAVMMFTMLISGPIAGLAGNTLWYGSFFFLGAWATARLHRWTAAPWWAGTLLLALLLGISALGANGANAELRTPAMAGVAVAGIAVVIWLAPRIPRSGAFRLISWTGRHSIVVYVAHFPVVIFLRDTVLSQGELSAGVHVAVITVLALALTMLILAARPWTPWLYVAPGSAHIAARLR
ncbi:acyltransferase family protein [Nesterenkonia sphaerica]|uniref:Acyltransferase n=1 Tax=Nesterenkonia sphaerica TaxID=1804988 RepID=A0A5R9AA18_9MICC|nr:acyltransferase family protein [Nesterenkonia sphaerica]TLP75360.1 acyltransferase [Nesterenkonia sphaerica]